MSQEVEELKHLCRFLASAWDGADSWIWENAADSDAIDQYPIVQGTGNQLRLRSIGNQPADPDKIRAGVELMTKES